MATAPDAAELVTNYFGLAVKHAAKWGKLYPWLHDQFVSVATEELWRASTEFDPQRCPRFATYLIPRIRWVCLEVIRSERTRNPPAFAPQWTPSPKSDTSPLEAAPGRFADPAETAERLDLAPLLATLPPDRRELVVRHVADAETLTDLAAARGRTRARVGQIVEESVAALRTAAGVE
ncbi:sigma-70 family RNA polymerase sigma factor [Gemmata sp.]|uniref:sigma-70 family RNA polymerase sigma factor n=1 Tax=Gemmata sp. TaxID=1914242 RepID=UPI003F6F4DCA